MPRFIQTKFPNKRDTEAFQTIKFSEWWAPGVIKIFCQISWIAKAFGLPLLKLVSLNDIQHQIHEYTKYTNTQIHEYMNTRIQELHEYTK